MYTLRGFETSNTMNGCDCESTADTLKDAKRIARYMLTDTYRNACEASSNLAVVHVYRGPKLVADFYA